MLCSDLGSRIRERRQSLNMSQHELARLLDVHFDRPAEERFDALKKALPDAQIYYAMKANPHPAVLQRFAARGLGFECVSPGELDHLFATLPDLEPDRVLFTPNFAPRTEYAAAFDRGVRVTLDNLHPLASWPEVFAGREVFVRVDEPVRVEGGAQRALLFQTVREMLEHSQPPRLGTNLGDLFKKALED